MTKRVAVRMLSTMTTDVDVPRLYDRVVPAHATRDMGVPIAPLFPGDSIEMELYIDSLSEQIGYCRYVIHTANLAQGESNFAAEWRFSKVIAEHARPEIQYAHAQARALQKLQDEAIRIYAQRFLSRPSWRRVASYWWMRLTRI